MPAPTRSCVASCSPTCTRLAGVLFGAASRVQGGGQEATQLLVGAGMACSGIYYLTMFAVVLWGRLDGEHAPLWLKIGACSAAGVTVLSVVLQVVPILDVAQPGIFAAKVGGGVLLINAAGIWVYRRPNQSRAQRAPR